MSGPSNSGSWSSAPQDEVFRAAWLISKLSTQHSEPLLNELTDFLRSDPSPAQLERASKVLKAVTDSSSSIPIISHTDVYHSNTSFVLRNALDTVLDFLPIRDVVSISQLSHHFRRRVLSYLVRTVNLMLKRWFPAGVQSFRETMKQTGCVLSGSTVLSYLEGAGGVGAFKWTSKDLDIYVGYGSVCSKLLSHLVSQQSFKPKNLIQPFDPNVHLAAEQEDQLIPNYSSKFIFHVHKLVKVDPATGEEIPDGPQIDIIECTTSQAIRPIFCFHSTFVMNWITHDQIVVTYPNHTFDKRGLIHVPGAATPRQRAWKEKYEARGFTTKKNPAEYGVRCGSGCPILQRNTKDVGCMIVKLQDGEVEPVPEVSWQIGQKRPTAWTRCDNTLCERAIKVQQVLRTRA